MKTVQRGVVAATIILSLGGCQGTKVSIYNPIDSADKTISVPAGDSALMSAIKQRLEANGWRLTVESDPAQPAGTTSPTRYRLVIGLSQRDTNCYPKGGPEVSFDFRMMDNKTRDAVLIGSGRDCSETAADKIIAAVRRAGRR